MGQLFATRSFSFQSALFFLICYIPLLGTCQEQEEIDNLPVDRPQNFQLLFNRGLVIGSVGGEDQVPINGSFSGSMFLGLSFKAHFPNNKVGARIAPGINWYKLNYQQEDQKIFPTDSIYDSEKHVLTYLEVPIGIFVNITKDEDGDPRLYTELGGFLGYKLSGAYKRRFDDKGRNSRLIRREVPGLEDWRFGIYGRLGFKRWALYYSYLLSDVFSSYEVEEGAPLDVELSFPPPLEIGISFIL